VDKLLETVKHLSFPRRSASAEEARAAEYVASRMKQSGIDVTFQPFWAQHTFSWVFACIYAANLIAPIAALYSARYLALFFGVVSILSFYAESNTHEVFARLVPKFPSRNVIGVIPAARERLGTIIISAHYDSSRSGLSFHPKMVKGLRTSYILMSVSLAVNSVVAITSALFGRPGIAYLAAPTVIYIAFAILLFVHREFFGKVTPGANDNASGVAVLLDVADRLSAEPPRHVEVYLVATGAEEAGTVGMIRFLDAYKASIKGAQVINLDNLGTGNLKYITAEGMLHTYRSSPELLSHAEVVASENPDLKIGPMEYRALTTDSLAAMVRSYPALCVMAFDDEGILPNWHWPTDTWENVDPSNLARASEFVYKLISRLDAHLPLR